MPGPGRQEGVKYMYAASEQKRGRGNGPKGGVETFVAAGDVARVAYSAFGDMLARERAGLARRRIHGFNMTKAVDSEATAQIPFIRSC